MGRLHAAKAGNGQMAQAQGVEPFDSLARLGLAETIRLLAGAAVPGSASGAGGRRVPGAWGENVWLWPPATLGAGALPVAPTRISGAGRAAHRPQRQVACLRFGSGCHAGSNAAPWGSLGERPDSVLSLTAVTTESRVESSVEPMDEREEPRLCANPDCAGLICVCVFAFGAMVGAGASSNCLAFHAGQIQPWRASCLLFSCLAASLLWRTAKPGGCGHIRQHAEDDKLRRSRAPPASGRLHESRSFVAECGCFSSVTLLLQLFLSTDTASSGVP